MFRFRNLKDDTILNFFLSKFFIFPVVLGAYILIWLGFAQLFFKINFVDAGVVGHFVMGISTFIAILFGGSYWLQKRSQASMKLLSLFTLHINNMIEIMQNPVLYQTHGYYPFAHPEKRDADATVYWERPCRLIYNEFGILKKELGIYSSFVRGENFSQLMELEQEVQAVAFEINNWLAVKLGNNPEKDLILQHYDNFDEYKMQLTEVSIKAKKFLSLFM